MKITKSAYSKCGITKLPDCFWAVWQKWRNKGMRKVFVAFLSAAVILMFPSTSISKDNDTWISEMAQEACIKYGEQYGICPELLMAIVERESSGVPDAENGDCKGLMQIYTKWHSDRMDRLGVTDIFDEQGNILVGTDLLAELFEKYGDAAVVLMAYHGERNPAEKAERGEISDYAQGILERSAELERIHGK